MITTRVLKRIDLATDPDELSTFYYELYENVDEEQATVEFYMQGNMIGSAETDSPLGDLPPPYVSLTDPSAVESLEQWLLDHP